MAKLFNKWLDEFVQQGADADKVIDWPENVAGDGTLPIEVPSATAISFVKPALTITPGNYSDLEQYNPTFSYIITFNNIDTIESNSTTVGDITPYLNEGSNTVSIVSKSTIRVSENQENIAYSSAFTDTITLTYDYVDLDNDFTRVGSNARINFSNENTEMEFYRGNWSGGTDLDMTYNSSIATYNKVKFKAKGNGAVAPYIDLLYSTDGTTYSTLDTIQFDNVYEYQPYEYDLPAGTINFKMQMRLVSSNYDPHICLKNLLFVK